jgi:hypothetical protein
MPAGHMTNDVPDHYQAERNTKHPRNDVAHNRSPRYPMDMIKAIRSPSTRECKSTGRTTSSVLASERDDPGVGANQNKPIQERDE